MYKNTFSSFNLALPCIIMILAILPLHFIMLLIKCHLCLISSIRVFVFAYIFIYPLMLGPTISLAKSHFHKYWHGDNCSLFCVVFNVQFMVGLSRLELLTSRLSGVRSNQLSYRPIWWRRGDLNS